ncbi:unnamed protein product, partial [Phaeothamnion confervicola]
MRELLKRQQQFVAPDGGPFVCMQSDGTTCLNTAYSTLSVTFVDESYSLVRLALATRSFPGGHRAEHIADWISQVTTEWFEELMGEDVTPADVYVGGIVDQAQSMINALEILNVPLVLCNAHRLNTSTQWGLGLAGSDDSTKKDGKHKAGTIKNKPMKDLLGRLAGLVGVFSHSTTNNDRLKRVQEGLIGDEGEESALELVRRNDTRWTGNHGMMDRVLRLEQSLKKYFLQVDTNSIKKLTPVEWECVRQATGILDEVMHVTTSIQGGEGTFLGQVIFLMAELGELLCCAEL